MFTFAGLCRRHHGIVARGVKVVLVNGTRLDRIWRKATRSGELITPERGQTVWRRHA